MRTFCVLYVFRKKTILNNMTKICVSCVMTDMHMLLQEY